MPAPEDSSDSKTKPSARGWAPPTVEELDALIPAPYGILELLGTGGMGAVYKARQENLGRFVAIKILPAAFSANEDATYVERFRQEAQAMASVTHPQIVAVYAFGETAGDLLYFVMEYVDGTDIREYLRLRGGTLPLKHALDITAHVLDALAFAHGKGIVHRDIKPANILISSTGEVKIADFGLAKLTDSEAGLTMTGIAMGTPDFVAPEVVTTLEEADHRADLYAIGVMLYQLLTGKLPRGRYKSATTHIPSLDPRVDGIIDRAMEPDPAERFQSAHEMRLALDELSTAPLARADPKPPEDHPVRRRKFAATLTASVLLIAALVYFFVNPGTHDSLTSNDKNDVDPSVPTSTVPAEPASPATTTPGAPVVPAPVPAPSPQKESAPKSTSPPEPPSLVASPMKSETPDPPAPAAPAPATPAPATPAPDDTIDLIPFISGGSTTIGGTGEFSWQEIDYQPQGNFRIEFEIERIDGEGAFVMFLLPNTVFVRLDFSYSPRNFSHTSFRAHTLGSGTRRATIGVLISALPNPQPPVLKIGERHLGSIEISNDLAILNIDTMDTPDVGSRAKIHVPNQWKDQDFGGAAFIIGSESSTRFRLHRLDLIPGTTGLTSLTPPAPAVPAPLPAPEPASPIPSMRTWTNTKGQEIRAIYLGQSDGAIDIRREDGDVFKFPLATLSERDRSYVEQFPAKQKIGTVTEDRLQGKLPSKSNLTALGVDLRPFISGRDRQSDEIGGDGLFEWHPIDFKPPPNLRIEFEIERIEGTGSFVLGLPTLPSIFHLDHRLKSSTSRTCGISGGFRPIGTDLNSDPNEPFFPIGKLHRGSVEISGSDAIVSIESPKFSWRRPLDKLTNLPPWKDTLDGETFFIGSRGGAKFRVHQLKLFPVKTVVP